MNARTNFNYYLTMIFLSSLVAVFTLIGFIKWVFHA